MNSVATATGGAAAFLGADFMLVPRWLFGADDTGAAAIIFIVAVPVSLALLLSVRFPPHVLGPHESARAIHGSVAYAVATGWLHGARTVLAVPTVAGTLSGLAAHRMVFGINTLLVLVMVRHSDTQSVAGFGTAALFFVATGIGAFLANVITPSAVGRWGRYRTANGALLLAAVIQLGGVGLQLPMMVLCGFLLGAAGQVVKLCADTRHADRRRRRAARPRVRRAGRAVLDVVHRRAHRGGGGHPRRRPLARRSSLAGSAVYLVGLAVHAGVGPPRPSPELG